MVSCVRFQLIYIREDMKFVLIDKWQDIKLTFQLCVILVYVSWVLITIFSLSFLGKILSFDLKILSFDLIVGLLFVNGE